jgi:hypothetical protein
LLLGFALLPLGELGESFDPLALRGLLERQCLVANRGSTTIDSSWAMSRET